MLLVKALFQSTYLDKKSFDSLFNACEELCKILRAILRSCGRIRTGNDHGV
jgi:hypothetical protein